MTKWTAEAILRESAGWTSAWIPADSAYAATDEFRFSVEGSEATLRVYTGPDADADGVLARALAAASDLGVSTLRVTIGPGLLGGVTTEHIAGLSPETVEIYDILAIELDDEPWTRMSVANGVEVREIETSTDAALFDAASESVWGAAPLDGASTETANRTAEPGSFVALLDGTPVASGGFSLSGPVARLWGGGVVASARGRGVYRALVARRLAVAAERGATLAIVHAQPTSSPILQRSGFAKYGERRLTRLRDLQGCR